MILTTQLQAGCDNLRLQYIVHIYFHLDLFTFSQLQWIGILILFQRGLPVLYSAYYFELTMLVYYTEGLHFSALIV